MLGRGVKFEISRGSLIALGVLTLISLGFHYFPEVDLWAAKQLYLGKGMFLLSDNELAGFFHKPVDRALKYGFLGTLIAYLLARVSPFKVPQNWCEKLNFVFTSTFVSVVVIINGIFKEFWGRARPSQIREFGGKADFTPAWEITNQCHSNCSFTSGHAGMAACVALLAIFLPAKFRKPYLVFAVIFYAIAGFMRMAVGGHFLSDVTLSGLIVYAIAMITKDIIKPSI